VAMWVGRWRSCWSKARARSRFAGSVCRVGGRLGLMLSLSWPDLKEWGGTSPADGCRVQPLAGRSPGTPVVPELKEVPWWEGSPSDRGQATQEKLKEASGAQEGQRAPDGRQPAALDLLDPAHRRRMGYRRTPQGAGHRGDTGEFRGASARRRSEARAYRDAVWPGSGYVERRAPGGEMQPQRVRVGRIARLADDLALALAAAPIRIQAPVPGRPWWPGSPNEKISLVSLRG